MTAHATRLLLRATGAATTLGPGPVAAAAIRAGMSRPTPIDAALLDEETHELVQITGHARHDLTEGFDLVARWVRLASSAVEDLLTRLTPDATRDRRYWQRARVLLVVPMPLEAVFLAPAAEVIAGLPHTLGAVLIDGVRLPISVAQVEVVAEGHVGAAIAATRASELLAAGHDRVLVVAVDSYLDPLHLELLADDHRLKSTDNPVGLAPGEAAVAWLLEAEPTAQGAGVRIVAVAVDAPSSTQEVLTGQPLSRALVGVLDQLQAKQFHGDVFIDLNGETWRAAQWGNVLARTSTRMAARVRIPAISVGEVGAASGALGVLLAQQALVRRYAADDRVLVLSSGESGRAACIAVVR